ncbi:MAG: Ig-like domain-containing protein [Clostridiales bacterium]|nr:Ig-like domain-containing protein [Clostridiales bacterium]
MKKKTCIFIFLALFVYLLFPHTRFAYYKPIVPRRKLTATSLTMKVGKTAYLHLQHSKKPVRYFSLAPHIASVSPLGKITAKRTGTTIIKVICQQKCYRCKVTVVK